MATFLCSETSVENMLKKSHTESYTGEITPNLSTACFSSLSRVWKTGETMFFGFLYKPGLVEKIVEDFNKFFKTVQVSLINKEQWFLVREKYFGVNIFPSRELAEKSIQENNKKLRYGAEIIEITFAIFCLNYNSEYSELSKFVLFTYYAEIIREISEDYFPENKCKFWDLSKNYVETAITTSNEIGPTYGNIFNDKVSLEEIREMDDVKLINSFTSDTASNFSFLYFIKPTSLLNWYRYKKYGISIKQDRNY